MTTTELKTTQVGKIVAEQPGVARIFEKYKIDYCCQGTTTLADACKRKKVDAVEVIHEIQQAMINQNLNDTTNWSVVTLTNLTRHIVETHHRFLQSELPRISALVAKVNKVHVDKHPDLAKVLSNFELMRSELESHMAKEEGILFPAIETMESQQEVGTFPFGSVANPIGMMEHEHVEVGNTLTNLRELTGDYTPPSAACTTWRVMLEALENLEQDLHLHIHKENNILFPRAIALESAIQ